MKNINISWLKPVTEKLLPLLNKYKAVLIVLLTGLLLLASGGWFRDGQEVRAPDPAAEPIVEEFSLPDFESTLEQRLGAIEGAGRVSLMLSLEQTETAVYAVNERETSGSTSSRESTLSVVSDGSYGEAPVTVKSLLPTFRGAVVLCDGADDSTVRYAVTQAVSTVCGIGTDKVTVLKMAAGA